MKRRLAALTSVVLVLGAVACSPGAETGPERIAWDRDVCERCQMVISDRVHASQLRIASDRDAHVFDDLGCALLWLDEAGVDATEAWVRSPAGTEWIDGHAIRYRAGRHTPMGYGFGPATSSEHDGSEATFEEVRARVRAMEDERRSDQ